MRHKTTGMFTRKIALIKPMGALNLKAVSQQFFSGTQAIRMIFQESLENNKRITPALIGRTQCFYLGYILFLNCLSKLMRLDWQIAKFGWIVEYIQRRKTRKVHSFSLTFGLYNDLRCCKVRKFPEFFSKFFENVRMCFNSP